MTDISSLTRNSTTGQAATPAPRGTLKVDQNQFLKLFIAQLHHQDPLAPQDTNQMLTQLSQISSVQGIESINQQLSKLSTSLNQAQITQAAELVGKSVWIRTNQLDISTEGQFSGQAKLEVTTDDVLVRVYDTQGKLVQSRSLGRQQAGIVKFDLEKLPPGRYTVTATGVTGNKVYGADIDMKSVVTGVNMTATGPQLRLNGLGVKPLSSISVIEN